MSEVDYALHQKVQQVSNLVVRLSEQVGFQVNFSAGAACAHRGGESLEQLVARADQALYAAKHKGRGQLVVDGAAACAPMPQSPPEARLRLVSSPSRPGRGTQA